MILNLSIALAKKLKINPPKQPFDNLNVDQEWYGHLFYASKKPYILTFEGRSKLTAIIEAKGLKSAEHYAQAFLIEIKDIIRSYKLEPQLFKVVNSFADGLVFQRTTNKSTIAFLNHMVYHAKYNLVENNSSTLETAYKLNEMPINSNGFYFPIEMFAEKKMKMKYITTVQNNLIYNLNNI